MGKGCLALLALFGVALYLELRQARALELPHPMLVAAALAVVLTLAVGSVQGLAQAWGLRAKPESSPSEWRDGELVRVGGRLRGDGPLLEAPFSGRKTLFYHYWAKETRPELNEEVGRATFKGMDQTPWTLETAHGRIRLKGVPRMREFCRCATTATRFATAWRGCWRRPAGPRRRTSGPWTSMTLKRSSGRPAIGSRCTSSTGWRRRLWR